MVKAHVSRVGDKEPGSEECGNVVSVKDQGTVSVVQC